MRKFIVLVVAALSVVVVLGAGGGPAAGAGGGLIRRDGSRDLWFVRACGAPIAVAGACGAQVVTNSAGRPLASSAAPRPGAYGPTAVPHRLRAPGDRAPGTPTIAIVDAYDDPNVEADLAVFDQQLRAPAVHDRQRLLPQGRPERRHELPGRHELAPRDRPRRRDRARDLPELQDPARRGELGVASRPRHRGERRRRPRRERRLELLRRAASSPARRATTRYYNHPGVAITASSGDSGYGVEYPAASQYVTAVGGTTLNLNADKHLQERVRLERSRLRLLRLRAQAGLADRHRLRRAGPSPTSPPTPTRTRGAAIYDSVGVRERPGLVPGRRHEPRGAARRRRLRADRQHELQLRLGAVRARRRC